MRVYPDQDKWWGSMQDGEWSLELLLLASNRSRHDGGVRKGSADGEG